MHGSADVCVVDRDMVQGSVDFKKDSLEGARGADNRAHGQVMWVPYFVHCEALECCQSAIGRRHDRSQRRCRL